MPAPTNWTPNDHTILHAERVYNTSEKWVGKNVTLTRDQMYWYENKYAEYKDSKMLYKLHAEYCADDLEAFQSGHPGIFNSELLDELRSKASKTPILVEIRPKLYIPSYD
jgi:hypothetical protein